VLLLVPGMRLSTGVRNASFSHKRGSIMLLTVSAALLPEGRVLRSGLSVAEFVRVRRQAPQSRSIV
jgi:hypothetical protein